VRVEVAHRNEEDLTLRAESGAHLDDLRDLLQLAGEVGVLRKLGDQRCASGERRAPFRKLLPQTEMVKFPTGIGVGRTAVSNGSPLRSVT